ncbi:hypothetical protein DFH94DRAFT_401499 [Russula ochroleuca]|uniref:Uncharacterized protein n=1 Tax=Russula ochroleuca TaxID=152965 RepID=A0A9P5TAI2_9AGAM|nr:hypothetical protein DFH94DRAFT_401499 [Russula ochroleuca]
MKFISIFAVIFVSGLALAAPEPQALERRQVVSVAKSIASDVTSDEATSAGASLASQATSIGGDIATHVTSIGGKVYTEITSAGGSAITLAASGAGVVTTFAGSVYTVATSAAGTAVTGSGNAAVANIRSLHISVPVLAALATTAGGVLFGAWVAV